MSRKNGLGRITPTARNLIENPDFERQNSVIPNEAELFRTGRIDRERMCFGPPTPKIPIDYLKVSEIIRRYSLPNAAFYLDTNIFTGEQKPVVFWQSLLEKQIVVTPIVWQELQSWLENPFRNRWIRNVLLDARISRPSNVQFGGTQYLSNWEYLGSRYYIDLLAVRKRFGSILADEFLREHGREASADEFNKIVQSKAADHEFHLIRKGRSEIAKTNFFADEELVVDAACDAIINRREVTIITTDTDIQEQFVKLMKLFDWQYQALLFSQKYVATPDCFEVRNLVRTTSELHCYFADDKGTLIRKPTSPGREFVDWLLPDDFELTPVYCLLFGGDGENLKFTPLDYTAEHGMSQLLETKGKTKGLNTEFLDGWNCHVTGFPIGIEEPRSWVVIANDNFVQVHDAMTYPLVDIAIANYETP